MRIHIIKSLDALFWKNINRTCHMTPCCHDHDYDTLVGCIWLDSPFMFVLSIPFDLFPCLSFAEAIKTN